MGIKNNSLLLGLTIFTAYFWAFMWPVVYIIVLECQGKIVITHYFYKGEVVDHYRRPRYVPGGLIQ